MPGFFDIIFGSKPVEPEEPKTKKVKKVKTKLPQELPKQTLSKDYLRHVQTDEGNEIRKAILETKKGDEDEKRKGE